MVFDDLTLIEVHLPDDPLGRNAGADGPEPESDGDSVGSSESSGWSSHPTLWLALLVGLLVAVGIRKFRSTGSDEDEGAYEPSDVEIETES